MYFIGTIFLLFLHFILAESSKSHRSIFSSKRGGTTLSIVPVSHLPLGGSMSSSGGVLKDLGHPGLNEALKSHNSVTFKLVKTGKSND